MRVVHLVLAIIAIVLGVLVALGVSALGLSPVEEAGIGLAAAGVALLV